jgi:hypothetical protein
VKKDSIAQSQYWLLGPSATGKEQGRAVRPAQGLLTKSSPMLKNQTSTILEMKNKQKTNRNQVNKQVRFHSQPLDSTFCDFMDK